MLATFRETIRSIQDPAYGSVIIRKPLKSVFWYWTKYQLLFTVIPLFLFLAFATYFIPQLPRLLDTYLPPAEIGVKDGRFYSVPDSPLALGNQEFAVFIDPVGTPSRLDHALAGLMITGSQLIFKSSADQTDTLDLNQVPDFSLSTQNVTAWTKNHQGLLWLLVFFSSVCLALAVSAFYWVYKMISFSLWAFVFWIIAILFKKAVPYLQVFRLAVYAAVPSLLLSAVLFFAPNRYLSLIALGLFIYFALSWLWRLTPESSRN